jgi:hypothetical protein
VLLKYHKFIGLCYCILPLAIGFLPSNGSAQSADRRIQYSEILSDPDNISLSVKYAQQLINDGEFQKATVSLERSLLIQK